MHTSYITYSYTRVMIMTQPPTSLLTTTHILPTYCYCCQSITFPLCSRFHLVSFLPSYDTSSCSSSTETSPHETECPYQHCRLADFPSKFAVWSIFCLMDTVLSEMLTGCCSAGEAAKSPGLLVTIKEKKSSTVTGSRTLGSG